MTLIGIVLAVAGPASAQQPPPGIRFITAAGQDFTDAPRQWDLLQTLLELEPGGAVPWHRVNGRAIITVLSGQVTRIEDNGHATVFKAGETFDEVSEDHLDLDLNTGEGPARLLATFLLDLGAEPLIFDTDGRPYGDAPGPVFIAMARTSVGRLPAEFTLRHSVFEISAGFEIASHTHDAWNIVTEISGGHVTNFVNGVDQPGATFAHGPGDIHEGRYDGPDTVSVISASVGPTGAPPLRLLTPAATPASTITPPSTGDGGLLTAR